MVVMFIGAVWWIAKSIGLLEYARADRIGDIVRAARGIAWVAPVFVLLYASVASLGLPGTPLTLAGGALFGFAGGTLLNWTGATLGAAGAFLVARVLGRDSLRGLLGQRVATLDRLTGDGAFLTLLRLRLIPIVPFNALNFGAGLAGVKFRPYLAATAIGILPGTAVYTYFADALLSGVEGARSAAFTRLLLACALLIGLSFVPSLARRFGWIAAIAVALGAPVDRAVAQTPDHRPLTAMLRAYVSEGLVDYDAFARDRRFPAYLATLDRIDPATLSRDDRLAYWINVYNAYTIALINDKKERRSIRNINKVLGIPVKSPWAEPIVRAGGKVLTLDDVEHRVIRPEFQDARIHAALVCAALGCPPLREEAFEGSRLHEQLDDQVRRFLGQRGKNRVVVPSRTVYGSPIFTWYREDFGGGLKGIGAFWARYVTDSVTAEMLRSGDFTFVETHYDWSLNRPRR